MSVAARAGTAAAVPWEMRRPLEGWPQLLRRFLRVDAALWAPAAVVLGMTLVDHLSILRVECELRAATARAAVKLAEGAIAPEEAAARVRRDLSGAPAAEVAVSVSQGERAAVEARLPASEAVVFGFRWLLPDDRIEARAEADLSRGGSGDVMILAARR